MRGGAARLVGALPRSSGASSPMMRLVGDLAPAKYARARVVSGHPSRTRDRSPRPRRRLGAFRRSEAFFSRARVRERVSNRSSSRPSQGNREHDNVQPRPARLAMMRRCPSLAGSLLRWPCCPSSRRPCPPLRRCHLRLPAHRRVAPTIRTKPPPSARPTPATPTPTASTANRCRARAQGRGPLRLLSRHRAGSPSRAGHAAAFAAACWSASTTIASH